jgi:predicted amidohydrolase
MQKRLMFVLAILLFPAALRAADAPAGELRVGVAQPLVAPGDVGTNVRNMESLVIEAARRGAQLVVFSECGVTGYDLRGVGAKAALTLEDPALEQIAAMAREHRIAIATGFYERHSDKLYNSAAVFFPDGKRVVERKHNVMEAEKAVAPVAAAQREPAVFEINDVRCAVLICADAGIPGIFDELSERGCDAVLLLCAGAGDESFGVHQADLADPANRKSYAKAAVQCLDAAAIEQCLRLDMAQVACNQTGWNAATGYFHPGGSSIVNRTGEVAAVIPPQLIFERLRSDLAVGAITPKGHTVQR